METFDLPRRRTLYPEVPTATGAGGARVTRCGHIVVLPGGPVEGATSIDLSHLKTKKKNSLTISLPSHDI